ncbi:MAG: 16S rRNA (guanine(527)-N(7))-methyltransferase RsmG [Spirochaetales bacterium]|nr:16S rRNA (guanine(527)-N(7))-methyltransferase RsmG [Spirochaetales bacterium]
MESKLISGLTELGIAFNSTQITRLLIYIKEIEKWNTRFNMVKASGKILLTKHLFDTLAGFPVFLEAENREIILDIGSGAGFPGIPLSVFLPDSGFILSECSRVKASFLRNIAILLDLKNVEVFENDFKRLNRKADIITFRAFSGLDKILDDCFTLLNPGGSIIAYKGRRQKAEEELCGIDSKKVSVKINRVTVPFLEEERHLVMLKLIS